MTKQVRKTYRKHPKWAWAIALVVLSAAALVVALPALAADRFSERTTENILPARVNVGGSNFSCTTHAGGIPTGMSTFKISKPPTNATEVEYNQQNTGGSLPAGVKVFLKGVNGPDKGKKFSFRVTGARVFHVGVNGGSDTAWFNYYGTQSNLLFPGGVASDGALHATSDNQGNLYSNSHTTFCYKPVVEISGNVYSDTDGDGAKNGADAGIGGRTVSLSDGQTTPTSNSAGTKGNYSFFVVPGLEYTVCASAVSGEVQTQPKGNTACTEEAGYAQTFTGDTQNLDFGLAGGVTATCGSPLESQNETGDAEVQATFSPSLTCTSKVAGNDYVFTTYDGPSGSRIAKLEPVDTPVGASKCKTTGENCVIVTQVITWDIAADAPGVYSPNTTALRYDDPPYDVSGVDPRAMKFCKKVPAAGDEPRAILPGIAATATGDIDPNVDHTTCLVSSTQGPGPVPTRVDLVYSAVDGRIYG